MAWLLSHIFRYYNSCWIKNNSNPSMSSLFIDIIDQIDSYNDYLEFPTTPYMKFNKGMN